MEAAYEPVQQSYLSWVFHSLGPTYLLLLPLAALLGFVLTLILILRGRGATLGAALTFCVPAPLLVGFFAAINGAISSYMVIATSSTTPKPSEIAAGISTALVSLLIGLLLMAPSYLLALFGLFARSLRSDAEKPL
jgi:hypothetical protein